MDAVQISKRAEYALLRLVPVSDEEREATAGHVADHARGDEDQALLLAMLGLGS